MRTKREVQYILKNEKLVNDALSVALEEKNATMRIKVFIEMIGKNIHCDRIYILEETKEDVKDNFFEWCAEGVSSEKEFLQSVTYEVVDGWYKNFDTHNHLIIDDVDDLKENETEMYKCLKCRNIHSIVVVPLKIGGDITGFFCVDNPPEEVMHSITYIVEIVSHFIVELLERKKLIDKLGKLSYIDPLTGVKNRHALNEVKKKQENLKNVGILYCDVLGLKCMNDSLGHQAGDELLIRVSKCLQSTFRKNDIFRVGGDEFLVFTHNTNENGFFERVEMLRQKMKEYKVQMSLGAIWKNVIIDAEDAIAEADNLMYEDKKAFYASCKK